MDPAFPDSIARRPSRRLYVRVAACALLVPAAAGAFDLPPVGGIDAPGGDEKRVTVDVGLHFGTDSNIRRSGTDEESDTVTEILGGAAFWAGNDRQRFDLRAQLRADRYAEKTDNNFDETVVLFGAQFGGKESTVRAGLRGAYVSLGDPNDEELPDLIQRTRTTLAPAVDIKSGKLEFGIAYSLRKTAYDDPSYEYLDNDRGAFSAEVRWGRSDRQQVFAHCEMGDVDYDAASPREDLDFDRLYFGWRSDSPRLGLELAAGPSGVDVASLSGDEMYGAVRANLTGERRSLLLGIAHAPEAAATARYKVATRFHARFLQKANDRLTWSVGLTNEGIELVQADDPARTSIERLIFQGGVAYGLGSPGKTHGRLYLRADYEDGAGDSTYPDYDRLRVLFGVALVR